MLLFCDIADGKQSLLILFSPIMNLLIFLKNILQLILSPSNAWKDIEREETPVEAITRRGLYPTMAVMLVSVFIRPVYHIVQFDLVKLLQTALIQFVALFLAFFAGKYVIERSLPQYNESGESDPIAGGTVAAYGTGLMTIIQIIENLIPVQLAVIQLLPAFATVCIWKSARYLDIAPRYEAPFMIKSILALIAPVIVINLLMSYLIN